MSWKVLFLDVKKKLLLFLKIVLGMTDVVSDFLFTLTLLSGSFKLALYFVDRLNILLP